MKWVIVTETNSRPFDADSYEEACVAAVEILCISIVRDEMFEEEQNEEE